MARVGLALKTLQKHGWGWVSARGYEILLSSEIEANPTPTLS